MKRSTPTPTTPRLACVVLVLLVEALHPSLSTGQTGPTALPEVTITSTPAKTQKVNDLTARYRFLERYTLKDTNAIPGVACSSRIALIEVLKESTESPKGPPKRVETTRHAIFTERPSSMDPVGSVTSVVRMYERFKLKTTDPALANTGPSLEGLPLLVRPRLAELPQIFSLDENRSLAEFEYDTAAHQLFLPQVSTLLPAQVVRIGDTWKITRRAAQALLGDPFLVGDGLIGKLAEIRKEVDGPRMVGVVEINGKLPTPAGDSTVHAEILFTFVAESSLKTFSGKATFPPRPTEDITESRGSITEIRLARATTGPIPGAVRLRYQANRELTMHRQVGIVEGAIAPPAVDKLPEPTETNSWLLHVDPSFKFSFRHPQDLLFPERNLAIPEPKVPFLTRFTRDGRDILQVEFFPKTLTPEDLKNALAEKYKLFKMDLIKGEETWLPEADWPKMRVHRIDAEMKLADPKAVATAGSSRLHFDGYLINFSQASSLIVIASTSRDAVAPYRKEVEQILKTLRLDPPRPLKN